MIDLLCMPDTQHARGGAGTVHHIAFRTPDDASQRACREQLVELGFNVSPVMDRTYFHSIYFREPGGILFEIATDPPGFTTDETVEELGNKLRLPPWMEEARAQIEESCRQSPSPPSDERTKTLNFAIEPLTASAA